MYNIGRILNQLEYYVHDSFLFCKIFNYAQRYILLLYVGIKIFYVCLVNLEKVNSTLTRKTSHKDVGIILI